MKATQEGWILHESQSQIKPYIMKSLNQPQSESMDSTRILVSMKQKKRSKRNPTTGIKQSLNRTQSWEYGCDMHPNAT